MIVIGTAGHIDHGKTSLVGALTGIGTDRLKEEQERGISIELGFAYMDLGEAGRCGLVDVPGHERFVRQMIAGATGIDLVILVVAADEGVMQQTREHLDICRLLGIRRGLTVLTKVDLVDEEWLELVESDLEDFVAGSFLENAPVVHFAAPDTNTHGPLRDALTAMALEAMADGSSAEGRPLRLPVDRVFTMRGFGTVVTGTVGSGRLGSSDTVELLPSRHSARVRGMQSHSVAVDDVTSGQRAAVNLQGVERDVISRGDVVTHAGQLEPTRMLDVDLSLLDHVGRPMASQAKVLVHVGTSQANGTVVFLDRAELQPGETAPAQLRLDQYVVALGGDHVVLRGFEMMANYGKTVGGGIVRHPNPKKHKRNEPIVLDALEALRGDSIDDAVAWCLRLEGQAGATEAACRQTVNAATTAISEALNALVAAGEAFRYVQDGVARFVHRIPFDELRRRAVTIVSGYHQSYPHRGGVPRGELRSRIRADLPNRYFAEILRVLEEDGTLVSVDQSVRQANFEPVLNDTLRALRADILARLRAAALEPPPPNDLVAELADKHGVERADGIEMLNHLVGDGAVERVTESLVFASEHLQTLAQTVTRFIEENGEMSTPQLKELTGASRKYTVPLGEHLDAMKVTIRVGDVRKLRRG